MRKAERALDLWHPQAKAAWKEFHGLTDPAFCRMIRARNTPDEAQALFEYEATVVAARKVYHERLLKGII